ncbi:MAG: SusC/RagA family TonB-linked outer membrane protein [Bacteroidales bacterium]
MINRNYLLLMVALLSLQSIFMPNKISATQNAQDQRVTISSKSISLEQLLWEIKKQTNVKFVYGTQDIEKVTDLSINVKKEPVLNVLDIALKGTNLFYEKKDGVIYIKQQAPSTKPIIVKGIVKGADGESLPGATVMVKGTKTAVATDLNGNFTITIPKGAPRILQFSFIGMKTKEVTRINQFLEITLEDDSFVISEAVVLSTGYQKIDRRLSTSSIASISGDKIQESNAISLDNMLMGKIPGMTVLNNSSTPGATTKIRIRGVSTISGNREPLWVVDGIILDDPVPLSTEEINSLDNVNLIGNAISGLNPMDIESVDVLKDASSTAIYGVRAANGVIVVTTKKGKKGEARVSYSTTLTATERPHYGNLHRMNSKERIEVSKEIEQRGLLYGFSPARVGYEGALFDLYDRIITEDEFLAKVKRMEEVNTDWFDALFRTSFSNKHNLSVSGASDKVNYYFSGAYTDANNTVKNSGLKQYNANMKLIVKLSEKVTANIQLRGSIAKKTYLHSSISPYQYGYNTSRAISLYNQDGELEYYNMRQGNQQQLVYNILNEIDNSEKTINNSSLNFISNLEWRITPELRVSGTLGLNNSDTQEKEWFSERSYYAANLRNLNYGTKFPSMDPESPFVKTQCKLPYGGGLNSNNTNNFSYTARAQVDYRTTLNNHHEISGAAGTETRSSKYAGIRSNQFGYMPDRGEKFIAIDPAFWPQYNNMLLANPNVVTNRLTNVASFYGIATYSYKHRYIINFNIRADGSNKFGQDKSARFLPIWSLSGKWNIYNESFMRDIGWMNELAIKGSYGVQGNVSDDQTPSLIIEGGPLETLSQEYLSYLSKLPNPMLKWEKTKAYNVAAEFSLFKNRVSGTVEYYYKKGHDQIISKKVSPTTGMTSMSLNAGDITNKGYELIVNVIPVRTDKFTWSFSVNGAKNTNSVVKSGVKDDYSYLEYLNGTAILEGVPINTFYSYKYGGLDINGFPTFLDTEENEGETKESMYNKVFALSGSRIPDIQGGIGTMFKYQNWSVNLFFSYSIGSKIRLNNLYSDSGQILPQPQQNMSDEFVNRWRNPGDELITNIPVLSDQDLRMTGSASGREIVIANNMWEMYNKSDLRVVSGDNLRLRSASLRYQLPTKFCNQIGINNASLRLEGNNLFVIASKKLNGQDPDQIALGAQASPPLPSFSLSIDITL